MPGIPKPGITGPGIIGPRWAVVSSGGEDGGAEDLEEVEDEGLLELEASSGMAVAVAVVVRRSDIGRIGFIVVICWGM